VRLAKEFTGRSRQGVSSRTLGVLLWECGCIQLSQGDRREAEALWGQTEELAERTHAATLPLLVGQSQVVQAVLDGHLEEALGLLGRFVERADATGAGVRARVFGLMMPRRLSYQGTPAAPVGLPGYAGGLLRTSRGCASLPLQCLALRWRHLQRQPLHSPRPRHRSPSIR
jgi:hypothetical protein